MRRRGWLLVPCLALAGMLALVGSGVAQTQISPEEFLDRLRRAQELTRLDGDSPSAERMADLRAALGLPGEIAIGDWVVEIPKDRVLEGLSGESTTDFERASDRLSALEGSLTDALSRDAPDTARIAAALGEAYRGVVSPPPDPLALVLRFIGEVIEAILQRVGSLVAGVGNALAWIVLIAIGLIALALVLRSRLVPDRVSRAVGGARLVAGPVDWAARAEDALRAGDLHEAVRALYLALLTVLAGRGIVADAPALTAGEARFAVRRARPALFPAIARATESYERVVYGGARPDQRDVEHLREATAQARRP